MSCQSPAEAGRPMEAPDDWHPQYSTRGSAANAPAGRCQVGTAGSVNKQDRPLGNRLSTCHRVKHRIRRCAEAIYRNGVKSTAAAPPAAGRSTLIPFNLGPNSATLTDFLRVPERQGIDAEKLDQSPLPERDNRLRRVKTASDAAEYL